MEINLIIYSVASAAVAALISCILRPKIEYDCYFQFSPLPSTSDIAISIQSAESPYHTSLLLDAYSMLSERHLEYKNAMGVLSKEVPGYMTHGFVFFLIAAINISMAAASLLVRIFSAAAFVILFVAFILIFRKILADRLPSYCDTDLSASAPISFPYGADFGTMYAYLCDEINRTAQIASLRISAAKRLALFMTHADFLCIISFICFALGSIVFL